MTKGILPAIKATANHLLPMDSNSKGRIDTQDRYDIISAKLEPADSSLLDVGCANAFLTRKFLNEEMFCLGIEQRQAVARRAQIDLLQNNNIGVVSTEITRENVKKLPRFDVVLLLTVYQHLVHSPTYPGYGSGHGEEAAKEILQELAVKSEKLFFEIWDSPNPEESTPQEAISDLLDLSRLPFDINEGPAEFWKDYLYHILKNKVHIEYLGKVEYKGEKRNNLVFYIDTSTYESDS